MQSEERSEVDKMMSAFSGIKEYRFYDGTEVLQYDPIKHTYRRVTPQGPVLLSGVTDTVQIIDKSRMLVPWACKVMAQKIMLTAIPFHHMSQGSANGEFIFWDTEFENLILAAKSAHRDRLDAAASVGNLAHDWIERYIKAVLLGQIVTAHTYIPVGHDLPSDKQAANCCVAALNWMSRHNVRWISTEKKVFSRSHSYAGTLDGLCTVDSCGDTKCCRSEFKDRLSIADWKSSNDLRIEYCLQTAAYMFAYAEEYGVDIDDRWIIRLGKEDGEFEPWHLEGLSFDTDFRAFTLALDLKQTLGVIEHRMKERANEIKLQHKVEKAAEKQAALAIECDGYRTYKGIQRPRCNKGNPCRACLARYAETHPSKPVRIVEAIGPDWTTILPDGIYLEEASL